MRSSAHQAAAERIRRLCYDGLTAYQLRVAVLAELGQVTPIRGSFFPTVDPATLLYTSAVREGMPADATPRYVDNEFRVDDVNKFRDLARGSTTAATLDDTTKGVWSASARYRELIAPSGYGDELRAVFRTGSATWGFLCLHRDAHAKPFTTADLELVKMISADIAEGLRRATLDSLTATNSLSQGPGVITIAPDLTVIAATVAGECWLADLAAVDHPQSRALPTAVITVVTALAAPNACAPQLRTRGASGRWLTLHASYLNGAANDGTVAVVIEPATPLELQPLIIAAYALSPREAQVCALVLRGLATKRIATDLHIASHTVNDHIKSIFSKTGVSTRGELMSSVFQHHYMPPPGQ